MVGQKRSSHKLLLEVKNPDLHPNYQRAFRKSSRWWRSLFLPNPAGWGKSTAARLEKVLEDSNAYIQKLNDEYANPSGKDKIARRIQRQASGGITDDLTQPGTESALPGAQPDRIITDN